MRVGFFTYGIHGERVTGIARYAVELSRALKRIEPTIEITLLTPYPRATHPWYREFSTYPLPHLAKLPLAATLGNIELHRASTELQLDVLHDPCGIAPFLAPRAPYARVTTVHDAIPALYPSTQPLLTRLVYSTLVRSAGRTADAIFTVSHASAGDLMEQYGLPSSKLHVTYNGTQVKPPTSADNIQHVLQALGLAQPYFLYVGALHPRKNIRRTIEAFLRVQAQHREVKLAIVGPPSWGATDVLRGVLYSAQAESGIVFTGFVSDEHLRALYEGSTALVFPSLYEGFGLPALEAMSVGTPVIASNVSSFPEVVGEAGLLVDPRSTEEIAAAMHRLLLSPDLRRILRARGRQRSKAFTWDSTARQTLDVYTTVLGA